MSLAVKPGLSMASRDVRVRIREGVVRVRVSEAVIRAVVRITTPQQQLHPVHLPAPKRGRVSGGVVHNVKSHVYYYIAIICKASREVRGRIREGAVRVRVSEAANRAVGRITTPQQQLSRIVSIVIVAPVA